MSKNTLHICKHILWIIPMILTVCLLGSSGSQTATAAPTSSTYTVTDDDDFQAQIPAMQADASPNITIQLAYDMVINTQDFSGFRFAGIPGKNVTLTSAPDPATGQVTTKHKILLAYEFQSPLTLDSVLWSVVASHSEINFYCMGHPFETTTNCEILGSGVKRLFGGGSKGKDVQGDTHITMRGSGYMYSVYGGGLDSDVSGSTYITVDDTRINTGAFVGGGEARETQSGTVHGDTHLYLPQGECDSMVGGGVNLTPSNTGSTDQDKAPARVFGDTYVETGKADATEYCAKIGDKDCCIAGSICSTVTNTHFTIWPGTNNYSYNEGQQQTGGCGVACGAGISDIVLGTVLVDIKPGDFPTHLLAVAGCGFYDRAQGDPNPSLGDCIYQVRNINNEDVAVHIICNNAMQGRPYTDHLEILGGTFGINNPSSLQHVTKINGNMVIDYMDGDLDALRADSDGGRAAGVDDGCFLKGNAIINITGGRCAIVEGNFKNYENQNSQYQSRVYLKNVGSDNKATDFGYFYHFKNVFMDRSNVLVEYTPERWPGCADDISVPQNPFYDCDNLIMTDSNLVTCNRNTKLLNYISLQNSNWDCLGKLYASQGKILTGADGTETTILGTNCSFKDSTLHCNTYAYFYQGFKSQDCNLTFDDYIVADYAYKNDSTHTYDQTQYDAIDSTGDTIVIHDGGFTDKIYGNVKLNKSKLVTPASLQIWGNWDGGDSQVAVLEVDRDWGNYPDANPAIEILGTATNRCAVRLLDFDKYYEAHVVADKVIDTDVCPLLGDRFIVCSNDGDSKDSLSAANFYLINADAFKTNLFLKALPDAYESHKDAHSMFEVVSRIGVYFNENGGVSEASPRAIEEDYVADKQDYTLGVPEQGPQPKRFHEFIGWNFKADGTGYEYTADTSVQTSTVVYAQYVDTQIPYKAQVYVQGENGEYTMALEEQVGVEYSEQEVSIAADAFDGREIDGKVLGEDYLLDETNDSTRLSDVCADVYDEPLRVYYKRKAAPAPTPTPAPSEPSDTDSESADAQSEDQQKIIVPLIPGTGDNTFLGMLLEWLGL